MSNVYVAVRSAHVDDGGSRVLIRKGERIAEGHRLLAAHPELFKPADAGLRFGVEDAREHPAQKREAPTDQGAVRAWAKANDIDVPARGRIPDAVIEQYKAAHPES
ncbi:hypothetical protein BAY59_10775 [Prauserella coralliicola]|nr:hypothetical protein BAY59_10775 [Prauserella coralliicola]